MGDLTRAVQWTLERAGRDLSIAEIVDHLDADDDVFSTYDTSRQRKMVMRRLGYLRERQLVRVVGRQANVTRWTSNKIGSEALFGVARNQSIESNLSEFEWEAIFDVLPKRASSIDRAQSTREFVGLILQKVRSEHLPGLTERQASRFLSWRELGVWALVVAATGRRFAVSDFEKFAERLIQRRGEP